MKKMIYVGLLVVVSFFSACSKQNVQKESLTQYVEPRIGTAHCRWFHFAPGAQPFGLAKPAPATNASLGNKSGWEATGYDYRDKEIEGFPCLHEFQVGGISLMPTTGKLITIPGKPGTTGEGYRTPFTHDDEEVHPGYYAVQLKNYGVKAELTATKRVAYQRFTFPSSDESNVLFTIGHRQGESGKVLDAKVTVTPQGLVEGWVVTLPEYVNKYQKGATVTMYFSAVMDKKPTKIGTFRYAESSSSPTIKGAGAGAYLTYSTKVGESVTAQIGLSYTSVANARLNRDIETQQGKLDFDEARKASNQVWEDYLGRIRVETSNKKDKIKFYTSLYHAVLGRGLASDVNGAYPKHDGSIGQLPMNDGKPRFNFYNTDGIWGGQWDLIQLWALAYPEYLSDYVSTHVQVYKDAGWLGDGLACSRFVSGVGTNQVGNVIAAAYLCGIRDFDVKTAYEAARKNELDGTNRPLGAGKIDTDLFLKNGYAPHADSGEGPDEAFMFSASHTLEYSFGAYAVGQMAKALGEVSDSKRLMELSKGWEKIYDEKLNLIRPKLANGEFISNFDPMQVWRGFQEGNAWQYTFYVPHDVKSLVEKMGAKEFTTRLDSIFLISEKKIFSGGKEVGAFAGLRTLYNQGNQPCLHISWLFNEAGRPSLTQKWVRRILNKFYGTEGVHGYGYGQDEDQGQLGAWFVMSSMGLFDVVGLAQTTPSFSLGSTLFNKITIQTNPKYYSGKPFVIEAHQNDSTRPYVQGFTLNGEKKTDLRLPFETLVNGGKLEVYFGNTPQDQY